MNYSEKQLKETTQIAYLSLLEKGQDALESTGQLGPFSIKDIILSCIDQEAARQACIDEGIPANEITFQKLVEHSDISKEDKARIELFDEEILNWKIADINDFNQENGMYALVIETGDHDAIIAFRGSENMKKYQNLVNDWAKADFGLLNAEETHQQQAAEEFLDSLNQSGLLKKYDTLQVTGHSLGGNLASHFTVSAAEPGREDVFNKIERCINFDGPGVSDEYLKSHKDAIEKASSKISHYSWSAIGELLYPLPGEDKEFFGINNDLHKDNLIDRFRYKLIRRHDTRSLMFDEEGKAKRGKQDIFSMFMSGLSKVVDGSIPAELTTELFFAASTIFKAFTYEKEDGSIGFKLPFMKVNEKAAENPFCKKCGDCLLATVNNIKERFNILVTGREEKKSGFADVAEGIQNEKGVRTSSLNDLIKSLGKEQGRDSLELAM